MLPTGHINSSNTRDVNLVSFSFAYNYSSEPPSPNFHLPMKFLVYLTTVNSLLFHQHDDSRRLTGRTLAVKFSPLYNRALQSGRHISKCQTVLLLNTEHNVPSKVSLNQHAYEAPKLGSTSYGSNLLECDVPSLGVSRRFDSRFSLHLQSMNVHSSWTFLRTPQDEYTKNISYIIYTAHMLKHGGINPEYASPSLNLPIGICTLN